MVERQVLLPESMSTCSLCSDHQRSPRGEGE